MYSNTGFSFIKASKISDNSDTQEFSAYRVSDLFGHFLIFLIGILIGVSCLISEMLTSPKKDAEKVGEDAKKVAWSMVIPN